MKSIFPVLLGVIAIGLLCFASSCTREYVCKCTYTYSGHPGLPEADEKDYPIRDTKSNAKSKCQASSRTYDVNGIKTVEACDLW